MRRLLTLVALLLGVSPGASGQIVIPGTFPPPDVVTQAADTLTATGATLHGTMNAHGLATNTFFVWGPTVGFGNQTPLQPLQANTVPVDMAGGALVGLACGTTYYFQASATNTAATTNGSTLTFTTASCGPPPTPPTVVTTAATSVTMTGATLTGTANPNSSATTGAFNWGLTTGYGTTTASQALGAGASPVAIGGGAIAGLTCNTLYHFRATATNAGGTVNGSDATFTTSACPTAPTVVTGSAGSITTSTATLAGTANPNSAATTGSFAWGLTTGYGSTTTGQALGSGTSAVAIGGGAITGLTCNTLYHFRATATNSAGTTNGSDATFTTSACPAPTVVTQTATTITQTTATLTGTGNPNGTATTGLFEWGTTTGYGSTTAGQALGSGASPVAITGGGITGLTCNTLYHFRATATNTGGTTNGSDATFTTGACGVTLPTVVTGAAGSITQTTATLAGTANPNSDATTGAFNWGLTTGYGTTTTPAALGSGASPVAITGGGITGLVCGTTYHFRATATNSGGTTNGSDASFATSACPSAPTVVTGSASTITTSSATLAGTANPNGTSTTGAFNWGLTTGYGTTTAGQALGAGSSPVAIGAGGITGLTCGTTYHFRATATNVGGTTNGSDASFGTNACGGSIATWTVNSTGPITMGLVTAIGVLPAGQGVQVGNFATQTQVMNTWPDGSSRHALVSFNATSTGAKAVAAITNPGGSLTPTWPSASVAFTVSGTVYTATLPAFTGTNTVVNGAVARRAWVLVTPTTSGAVPHPTLQVIFEITSYAAGGHEVSLTVQNIRNLNTMDQVTANVTTTVNGSTFAGFSKAPWTIYSGQRWHRKTYVSMTEAVVGNDFEPWIQASVIPRITDADSKTYDLNGASYALGVAAGGYFGEAAANQADAETADRQELNPWTDWEARYFRLGDEAYRQTILANGNQSGAWTWQIDRAGDGRSILRMDQDNNAATVSTEGAIAVCCGAGLGWLDYHSGGAGNVSWRGALNAGTTGVEVNREHLPEMNFVAYLLTGDTFYLDQLRFQASWALFFSAVGYFEGDPYLWAGYFRGRHGTLGELNDAEMGRSFGRPFKFVVRAAWAIPDSNASDQTYFHTYGQNNLAATATYIDYLDSRSWGGSWSHAVGQNALRGFTRGNTVVSTTGASPTVFTVIGDNSGSGVNTDDHAMQTGDFADLSGFGGGASGLNGHRAITRLSATSFSVAVNTTGSPTSGVGTWSTATGNAAPEWRNSVAARETSWACFSGLWSCTASMWAYPDRLAQMDMAVQDNPTFDTAPGVSYNFYSTPSYVAADTYVYFTSWATFLAANTRITNTARFFDSQSTYTSGGITTHRGNVLFNDFQPNTYYTPYATVMLSHARRRGLAGAGAAYTKLVNAAGVLPELKRRPGFYEGVP